MDENSAIRLLLVEDDLDFSDSLSKRLAKRNYLVTTAFSGDEGLEKLRAATYDIIVCDINLGTMDGISFLQKMRDLQYEVPLIFLTGYASLDTAKEAVRLHAANYLLKPLEDIDVLIRAVNEAVDKYRLHCKNVQLMESLRLKVEELKAAQEVKTQFLANMSHEIRTPMNAIMGYMELMQSTALSEEQKDYVRIMSENTRHLLNQLDNVLLMTRSGSFMLSIKKEDCAVGDLVNKPLALIRSRIMEKKLKSVVEISAAVPERVRTDPEIIQQILLNLLDNAVKFTSEGEIRISVSLKEPLSENNVLLCFSVSDTGIGIAMAHRRLIFEPFTQVDMSHTRQYMGIGLGLSICRSYTVLMGGDIRVESEPGRGSTFSITIPMELGSNLKTQN